MSRGRTLVLLAGTLAVAVGATACGSDAPSANSAGPSSPAVVAVKAIDYAFEGVPATARAGTKLTLTNASTKEVHELVAVRLPDDERRPATELANDQATMGHLLGAGPPAAVLVASPGGAVPGAVVGDGSLAAPGRYLLICTIPTGADPAAYLKAAGESKGGPVQVPGGPPHATKGMVTEVTVT